MTLTELLVVIAIILLLSAATLPTAYVAFAEREVSEAASLVQANLSLTRDRAAGTGQPQGIRFLPDPDLNDPVSGLLVSNRMVALTTPPNYSEGQVIPIVEVFNPPVIPTGIVAGNQIRRLAIYGAKTEHIPNTGGTLEVPLPPTSWYFNIRQGDRIRIGGAGNVFTIAGPMTLGPQNRNPERFINQTVDLLVDGTPVRALPVNALYEILHVVNGRDDDGDGYIDEQFDGIDNSNSNLVDPAFNGVNDATTPANALIDEPLENLINLAEYEEDAPIIDAFGFARVNNNVVPNDYPIPSKRGEPAVRPLTSNLNTSGLSPDDIPISDVAVIRSPYTISRRPSVSPDAQEYALPTGAVIDLTTSGFGSRSERSRVPIDPQTGYVELMVYPNGQVVPSTPQGFGRAMDAEFPLYFLWVASREDVHPPTDPDPSTTIIEPIWPLLPLPTEFVPSGTYPPAPLFLQGYRRLITISPTSGNSSVSEIGDFGSVELIPSLGRDALREFPYREARRFQVRGR
jgi:type II secretory pathway pseudopilin PulG